MPLISRRNLLSRVAVATTVIATSRAAFAQSASVSSAPFMLPPLPYATDALEPVIDAQTMELHHDRHHGTYVSNLNEVAKTVPQIADHPVEYVLSHLDDVPDHLRAMVRNNMGGHANHSMYWVTMGPNGGQPDSQLQEAVDRDLGGMENLKRDFNDAGSKVFGSGWVFVTVNDGKLAIETRPNQDTPLMDGKRALFGNDVWEHAYYLKYQNRRADYLGRWWSVVDWSNVSARYTAALNGTLGI